jgi:2-keto-3-deoxy-L-rhamnonate aldolase RhmA
LLTTSTSDLLLDHVRLLGLGFLILDAELDTIGVNDCADVVRKFAGSATHVAVRLPEPTPAAATAFANTGVDELVIPGLRTPGELEQIWRAVAYPPRGTRARQPSPSSGYGTTWTEPGLSLVVETAQLLEHLTDLADDDRVDGLWLGRNDLAHDLDATGSPLHLETASQLVIDAASRAGKLGVPSTTLAGLTAGLEQGASRVAMYWDLHLRSVLTGIRDVVTCTDGPVPAGRPASTAGVRM